MVVGVDGKIVTASNEFLTLSSEFGSWISGNLALSLIIAWWGNGELLSMNLRLVTKLVCHFCSKSKIDVL
jgi:hypothetical protein